MTGGLPREDWYPVGGSGDLPPGAVRPAGLFGTDIACWRAESGGFHAWRNRCGHRGMRLSFGFVRGDRLACRYHGWRYDESGECAFVPAHPKMKGPRKAAVPAYASAEQDGLLWVSLGDGATVPPALAELAPDDGAFTFCRGVHLARPADDDLMDRISRLVFPPAAMLGDDGSAAGWRYDVRATDEDGIEAAWHRDDDPDRRAVVRYRSSRPHPGLILLTAESDGVAPESRLLAVQPVDDDATNLYVLVAAADGEAARPHAAHWARRVRWFLANDMADIRSYDPWTAEGAAA